MSLRRRQRAHVEQLILSAAAQAFAAGGYHGTSMDEIARAVDCAPATLYGYFKGKSELFHRLMAERGAAYLLGVQDALDAADCFETGLDAFLDHFLHYGAQHEAFLRLLIRTMRAGGDALNVPDPGPIEEAKKLYRRLITGLMQRGLDEGALRPADPELLALAFLGTVHALSLGWLDSHSEERQFGPIVRLARDLFLNGASQ